MLQGAQIITLPITMPGAKPGDPQQTVQIQVVNPQPTPVSQAGPTNSPKYQISQIPIQAAFGQGATVLTVAYNSNQDGIQIVSLLKMKANLYLFSKFYDCSSWTVKTECRKG